LHYFLTRHEYERARVLVAAVKDSPSVPIQEQYRALLDEDWPALVDQARQAFLNEGQLEHLGRASDYAERAAGWQEATLWTLRTVLLTPISPQPAGKLFTIMENANRFQELAQLLQIYKKLNLHPDLSLLLEARLCLEDQKYERLVELLRLLSIDRLDERLRPKAYSIKARACEAQKKYEEAVKWFEHQNDAGRGPALGTRSRFFDYIKKLEQIDVCLLAADSNKNYFSMVGFPRSGTTLLENALAAHPQIETFEEIPSDTVMFKAMTSVASQIHLAAFEKKRGYEAARECYYSEIRRRSKKKCASVFVDKLPLRSAYIAVLEKVFPERKYIFSVRHPYDVVLSCFQQRFKLNQAMEHFRRFEDACMLYNNVMQRWFEVFPTSSERVHYVKYDDLVVDFDEEIRKVLAFVGVDWDDSVRNFAATAERRKVATPSYSKVRAGLNLGIQTRWRDYGFLFEKPAAAPLKSWVKRLGYEAV
jgi:tetratricopeptide (TPR) repeat protein